MLIIKRPKLPADQNLFVHNWAMHTHLAEPERVSEIARKLEMTEDQVRLWLGDTLIQQAILHEIALDEHEHGVDTANILRQVSRMTFYDPALVVDQVSGAPTPLHRLPEEIRAAIQGVKVTVTPEGAIVYDYKFCDRNSSIDKLMRYMGLFEKDNKQQADIVTEMLRTIYAGESRLPIKPSQVVDIDPVQPAAQPTFAEPISIEGDPSQITFDNPYAQ